MTRLSVFIVKRNRSRVAYSGVFPEVEVDMRFEDIASNGINAAGTPSNWLRKCVSMSTRWAERRVGRTVLARRKRLQLRTRKEYNNRLMRGPSRVMLPLSQQWVEWVIVAVRPTLHGEA